SDFFETEVTIELLETASSRVIPSPSDSDLSASWSAQADHPRFCSGTKASRGSSAFAEDDGGESLLSRLGI
ncbi:MAG: hypothetical protein M3Y41_09920, partial [Pseudomonadota bacterium]|nr:hypothetical protein [Pseudomonadota bacterium]